MLLAPLADLDRREDLERWLAARAGASTPAWRRDDPLQGVIERLAEVLAGLRRIWPPELAPVSPRRRTRAQCLRGPPLPA